jgi:pimeloyl-ACP methyl ester carboxylesterase
MPIFKRDQVSISYEVHGAGFPLLALAPGGLRSSMDAWRGRPIDPVLAFSQHFRVITMDQRNASQSWAPISANDGWHTYASDHVALMDHLGCQRFHVIGMCIGGAYILELAKRVPERMASAVLLQPIGLSDNRQLFLELSASWQEKVRDQHPEATSEDYQAFTKNMFGGSFVFSSSEDEVARCKVPLMVLMGNDPFHPSSISRRVESLAQAATLLEKWQEEPDRSRAIQLIAKFFANHSTMAPSAN